MIGGDPRSRSGDRCQVDARMLPKHNTSVKSQSLSIFGQCAPAIITIQDSLLTISCFATEHMDAVPPMRNECACVKAWENCRIVGAVGALIVAVILTIGF